MNIELADKYRVLYIAENGGGRDRVSAILDKFCPSGSHLENELFKQECRRVVAIAKRKGWIR